jgi:hypothetical protein
MEQNRAELITVEIKIIIWKWTRRETGQQKV